MAKTTVECPRENQNPTLRGRFPSAMNFRVVLSMAEMWSASKAWRNPRVYAVTATPAPMATPLARWWAGSTARMKIPQPTRLRATTVAPIPPTRHHSAGLRARRPAGGRWPSPATVTPRAPRRRPLPPTLPKCEPLATGSGRNCPRVYAEGVTKSTAPPGTAPAQAATVEEVLDLVRRQGGRVTSSRRLLLGALFEAHGHRTAEELAAEVQGAAPDVHLSTIYRNLDELERLGVVVHAHLGHGPATYHLASAAHGHFVCEICGTMFEAPDELFRGLARVARSEFDFAIDPHRFAVLGRCADCR